MRAGVWSGQRHRDTSNKVSSLPGALDWELHLCEGAEGAGGHPGAWCCSHDRRAGGTFSYPPVTLSLSGGVRCQLIVGNKSTLGVPMQFIDSLLQRRLLLQVIPADGCC